MFGKLGVDKTFYMKVFKSSEVYQITPLTAMNRYTVIFSACKDY